MQGVHSFQNARLLGPISSVQNAYCKRKKALRTTKNAFCLIGPNVQSNTQRYSPIYNKVSLISHWSISTDIRSTVYRASGLYKGQWEWAEQKQKTTQFLYALLKCHSIWQHSNSIPLPLPPLIGWCIMLVLIISISFDIYKQASTHVSPAFWKTESQVKKNPRYMLCFLSDL